MIDEGGGGGIGGGFLLIQLLRLLDNLLPIATTAGPSLLRTPTLVLAPTLALHLLITKLRRRNPHPPRPRPSLSQSQLALIQHLHRQRHALGPEIHHQRIALEGPVLVRVEFDAGFARVDLFGDDAAAGEDAGDFVGGGGGEEWEVGYVDGGVFALAGFFVGFGFFGGGGVGCVLWMVQGGGTRCQLFEYKERREF